MDGVIEPLPGLPSGDGSSGSWSTVDDRSNPSSRRVMTGWAVLVASLVVYYFVAGHSVVHQYCLGLRDGRAGRVEPRQRGALEATPDGLASPRRGPLRLRGPPRVRLAHPLGTGFHIGLAQPAGVLCAAGLVRHPRLGLGVDPTVQLQRWLYRPGLHVWDYLVWACYMTHFFASFIIAGVLWKTNYPKFRRFVAAVRGPDLHRLHHLRALPGHAPVDGERVRAHPPHDADHRPGVEAPAPRPRPALFAGGNKFDNNVAAMPSLHGGVPDAHLPVLLEGLERRASACSWPPTRSAWLSRWSTPASTS